MKLCIQILLILSLGWANASEDPSIQYISIYKEIAISEMSRTGIPASIKLAQALLESGSGKSTLAREANNHFGIKCNGGWEGETYHHKDDDYKNGKLIKSCFRKFSSVSESFYAHSQFLADQNRYAFLFDFSSKDYHAWAHGLKKAGYATDKAYPQKLIKLIEKYQLYYYDDAVPGDNPVASAEVPEPVTISEATSEISQERSTATRRSTSSRKSSSRKTSTRKRTSRKKKSKGGLFKKKTKRKTTKSTSEMVFHIVREGQSMSEIAMIHDLDETLMRLRNRIPKDAEPIVGEKILLRKKINVLSRPKFTRIPDKRAVASQEEYIF